jgi:Spermine/spermidine synthase domain
MNRARLVLASFLMLFVELALIRWAGSNIVYLSYFSNFVLLGSFLGIGIGFLRADSERDLSGWAPVALALLVAFVLAFPVQVDKSGDQLLYFGHRPEASGLPIWVTLPVIFSAVATTMALLGETVARIFARFRPLEAFRLDLVGSIGGVAAFSLLSFLDWPPLAWGAVAASFFALVYGRRFRPIPLLALLALVAMLGGETILSRSTSWSPYYKIHTVRSGNGIRIFANGVSHQQIQSLHDLRRYHPIYFQPYRRLVHPRLDDVLIVGAGSGNDTEIALAMGARRVDAVEIDPRIYAIGKALHPNRPYENPRVHVHITDGRAFLEQTRRRYDLILFALPDSLTLIAGQSAIRLESYLFTREAIERVRDRLKPRGAFAMYNYYRQRWLVDRLAGTLAQVFGRDPCIYAIGAQAHLAVLTDSADAEALRCGRGGTWRRPPTLVAPATDDRPFVYLRTNRIPPVYLLTLLLILAASVITVRAAGAPFGRMRAYADLFFMGAAFLLIETKSIVQFALLFGTTWFVNALVFGGILIAVLTAVEVTRRMALPRPPVLYALLFAALAVAWAVPPEELLRLSFAPRFAAATALAFAPITFANLIFAQRFRDSASSTTAFGANLLGAMVGGLLEYSSLVIGYRSLLVVIALLYALAFAFERPAFASQVAAAPARAR